MMILIIKQNGYTFHITAQNNKTTDSNTHQNINYDGKEEEKYDHIEEVDFAASDASLVKLLLIDVNVAGSKVAIVFLVDSSLQLPFLSHRHVFTGSSLKPTLQVHILIKFMEWIYINFKVHI